MMHSIRWGISGAALVSALALAHPAGAQEAAQPASDEIVVTGEKTSRSLQETVTSVAVTTAQRIDEENLQTLYDIINRTPNVSETYGATGFSIRGISESGVSGGGVGGLATVYVDGAALTKDALFSGPLNMWDVAQVEILRGPQSTLQGRNSLAGAIIVRTQDATFDWQARVRALYSDADDRSIAFAVGGPLIDDVLAFRIAVEHSDDDGFIYNPTRHEDADAAEMTSARVKLLFTPTEHFTLRGTYTHTDRTSSYLFTYAHTDVPDYWDNRIDLSDSPNTTDNVGDFVTLEGVYDISDTLSLTSVTSWADIDDHSAYDGDLTAAPLSYGTADESSQTLTEELRLNYNGQRLDGLIGLYYSNRDVSSVSASLTDVPTPAPTLEAVLQGPPFGLDAATASFAAALYAAALPNIHVDYSSIAPSEIETMALFADATFALNDRIDLHAGFRYDREDYTITSTQSAVFAGTYPDPTLYGPYAPVIDGLNQVVDLFVSQASSSAPRTTRSFEAFLPKLGVTYNWSDDISTSFTVQRGYRSGGSSVNIARSTIVPYDPEYTWNYELAFRSLWLDGRLAFNANAYYIDWTDQQVSVNLGLNLYDYQVENAGASHLYGAEASLTYRASDHFETYASLGYEETKFDDLTVLGGGGADDLHLSGSQFHFAPRWTAAVGATYRWADGFLLNLNASYRSDAFADIGANQYLYAIDARTLVNGKIGYETERWGAYIYANNLFDEHYIQYPRASEGIALLGDPRVIGVTLEARW